MTWVDYAPVLMAMMIFTISELLTSKNSIEIVNPRYNPLCICAFCEDENVLEFGLLQQIHVST